MNILAITGHACTASRLAFFPTLPCPPFPVGKRLGGDTAPTDQGDIPQHMISSAKNSSRTKTECSRLSSQAAIKHAESMFPERG